MAKITKEQIEAFLNSPEANDVVIVLAFAIDKTPTETDNNVVASAGDYAELLAEKLSTIEEQDPTSGEAIQAAIRLAQKIASLTETKWDDVIVGLAARITGANKKD